MAGWTGLEPAASAVTGRRYNQLNYHPAGDVIALFWPRREYKGGAAAIQPFFEILNGTL